MTDTHKHTWVVCQCGARACQEEGSEDVHDLVEPPSCSFCGDVPAILHMHALCHVAAPLRIELHSDGNLVIFCYVSSCNRQIAKLRMRDPESPEYAPGEFRCPKCGFRRHNPDSHSEPELCPVDGTLTVPVSWMEAATDAITITGRWMRRAAALEQAWPDGYALPVEDDDNIISEEPRMFS